MITPDTQQNIIIKIEQAQECASKALQLCESYSRRQEQKHLKALGGYLGTYVNNLRSALNYASVDYCQQRGFTKTRKGKALSTDFPYSHVEDNFKQKELVLLISQSDPALYTFIEEIQPYHPNKRFLGNIMALSNMDKHQILVKVRETNIDMLEILEKPEGFFKPIHWGNTVVVGLSNGKPVLVDTPCYVPQLRMYALRNGNWLNFLIPIDDPVDDAVDHRFLEFIPFVTYTAQKVTDTLNKFYSLWN